MMTARRWERATGVAGLLMVLLVLGQIATWRNFQVTDSIGAIRGYFVGSSGRALAGVELATFGGIPLLFFAAGLRAVLRRNGAQIDVLPDVFFGAAIVFGAVQLAFVTINGAIVLAAPQATDGELRLVVAIDQLIDNVRVMPFGVMIGSSSLAMLGAQAFPRWTGWLGIAVASLLVVSVFGLLDLNGAGAVLGNIGQVGLLLFLIWAPAVSIALLRRPRAAMVVEPTGNAGPVMA